MNWMTLVANLTESLAWPLAITIMFWLGKSNFQSLLERLIKLQWGDKEATFSPAEKSQEGRTLEETTKGSDIKTIQIPDNHNKSFFPYTTEHIEEKYPALLAESERITNLINQAQADGESDQTIRTVLTAQLAMSNLRAWCEKEYNTIFGSQITLLKKLNVKPSIGLSQKEIEEHFANAYHAYPEFYKGIEVNSYLKFLFQSGVIEIKNGTYRITKLGISFLSWIVESGLAENKYG